MTPIQLGSGYVYWVPADNDGDFALHNDPPAHKPQQFTDSESTRQRVLVEGMDCLPGQMDLF